MRPLRHSFLLAAILPVLALACSGGGGSPSDPAAQSGEASASACSNPVEQKKYLMTFHTCDTAQSDCSNPQNHTVRLAGSDDGVNFSLVTQFTPRRGSVPDIVFHNGSLYLFHTGGDERWVKIDDCMSVSVAGGVAIDGVADSFVDPSALSVNGGMTLFYLPGVIGADPAGCQTYPCAKEIRSASAASGDPSTMASVSGARVAMTLTAGTFSDPDIVARSSGGYLLYVSSGQSVYVFTGADLNGTFTAPGGGAAYFISNNSGGVPGAVEPEDGSIWLYVTANMGGVEVIRRAVSPDGVTPLASGDFSTVISAGSFTEFGAATSFSSPSITRWK